MTFQNILKLFKDKISIDKWVCNEQNKTEYINLCSSFGEPDVSEAIITSKIEFIISRKMGYYKNQIKLFIDTCAKDKLYFNYQEKVNIANCVNANDIIELITMIESKSGNPSKILSKVGLRKFDQSYIINRFIQDTESDTKKNDIYESIFSSLLFSLFPKDKVLRIYSNGIYHQNFYDYLKDLYPNKYNRNYALSCLKINRDLYTKFSDYHLFLSSIIAFIKEEYSKLQNYCYLSIMIDSDMEQGIMWSLYSDIVLFAEKHIEEKLKIGYFHPETVKVQSASHIPYPNVDECEFDIANGGFTYKDCYIISEQEVIEEKESDEPYKILILFQKNKRDEDIIPCPACRSNDVRGNSYPVLGVKSWECNNYLCPDKSKYNRGKRYSLASIIKQEAIENPLNQIEKETLTKWHLDVTTHSTDKDIIEFLVKEYSLFNDVIYLYNYANISGKLSNRTIVNNRFAIEPDEQSLNFFESAFFKRFDVRKSGGIKSKFLDLSIDTNTTIYNGNCFDVLLKLKNNSLDGAITSPPYYNAKEYSHWDNIYCYLYDMYIQANEVYRVLKPGSYYLFNIFDYFDNENNIVFSAMGKKRMILGAYIIYLFRKIGFKIQQNTIWYKGEIQGYRNTNQGNISPYYQAPLNCYEHILCFRKPGRSKIINYPTILKATPVIKMIKGVNTYGHTAPFPLELPNLINSRVTTGSTIIDPYAGSLTSARSAKIYNNKSINIEISIDYCKLGINLMNEQM